MSVPSRHIPFTQLVDLVEARLTGGEEAQVRAHIAGCRFCQAEVAWLESIISLMRSDQGEDAPPQLAAEAVALFNTRRSHAPPQQRPRVRAVLVFDSGRQSLVAGMRGLGPGARQLLWSGAGRELDMRIVQNGSLWVVWGQLLGAEERGSVELEDATSRVQAVLSELNEFSLPPVHAGTYTLTIALSDVELEIADLQIGL